MFSSRHARRRKLAPTAAGFASMVLLSACVTINVYFPAAGARGRPGCRTRRSAA